jgi:outer membrane protein assembly factor BamB
MAVMDIETREFGKYEICNSSSWEHNVIGNRIYTGTVNGELIETDTNDMQLVRKKEICKKNIYSVTYHNGIIYTVSQDMTIKAVNMETFDITCVAKKAVKGMTKILGIYNDLLVIADGGISLWDIHTLQLVNRFTFPMGQFNKGVILHGNAIFGSDYLRVYSCKL